MRECTIEFAEIQFDSRVRANRVWVEILGKNKNKQKKKKKKRESNKFEWNTRLQGSKTARNSLQRRVGWEAAIATRSLLLMRYKMSSDIHQLFPCLQVSPPRCTCSVLYLSLSHPKLSPPYRPAIFCSHSFHPEHFPFFHLFSIWLPIPPTSLLPASLSLRLLDISLSPLSISLHRRRRCHHHHHPTSSSPSPLSPSPLWWMSLSAGCSSYLLSRGAHTVSLPRPPHLYP